LRFFGIHPELPGPAGGSERAIANSTVSQIHSPIAVSHSIEAREPLRAIEIVQLDPGRHLEWDRYVEAHVHGSPFHLMAWQRSIEQTFGYRPMHLAALRDGRIRGVLPLFLVENLLLGRVLLSTPFAVYGGVLGDDAEVREAFAARLRDLGQSLGVQHVELRNAHEEQCLGFARLSRYVTFTQSLSADEGATLEAIPRKTRYMVRKALKHDFTTARHARHTEAFEELYARNLRRLGTPSFPRRHFVNLIANFGESVDIRETVLHGEVVAAVMTFSFRDQILPYYGASAASGNANAANNFMYFDLMRWGGSQGYRWFDFGRSKKGSGGSYDFKSHWGMLERDLPYEILLVKRNALPDFSPKNPAFGLPIRVWRKLPLALTRWLGPRLIRLVP
jgi:FemAB-related protein (PEP-CTERM system-associated)